MNVFYIKSGIYTIVIFTICGTIILTKGKRVIRERMLIISKKTQTKSLRFFVFKHRFSVNWVLPQFTAIVTKQAANGAKKDKRELLLKTLMFT